MKVQFLKLKGQSSFQRTVNEARAVSRRLSRIVARTPVALSAQGFLKASIAVAETTPQRVDALDRLLTTGGKRVEHCAASVRRMMRDLQNGNLRNPPTDLSVIERFVQSHSSEAVPGELAAVGYTAAELFCAMIVAAGRRFPDHFGKADDAATYDAEVSALTKRLDELLTLISRSWSAADIEHAAYVGGKMEPPRFRGTPVSVSPPQDAGNRLLAFLEAERAKRLEAQRAQERA